MNYSEFYSLIQNQKIDQIIDLFEDRQLNFNTPLEGKITSKVQLEAYALRFQQWVEDIDMEIQYLNSIETEKFKALEFVFKGDNLELPVALIIEFDEDDQVVSIRDYHSTYPIYGSHQIRDPFLEMAEEFEEPDVVEEYMEALADGDAETIVTLFSQNAYFREPSGSEYTYKGKAALKELYSKILAKGGIKLIHLNAISTPETTVIEFIADKWGKNDLIPQAGAAFYDHSNEKLTAARIYDDVDPPL